jgi:hypothetical protein
LVYKSKGRRPLGILRRRRDNNNNNNNNIKMDVRVNGWEDMFWICVTKIRDQWQALVDTEMDFSALQNGGRNNSL